MPWGRGRNPALAAGGRVAGHFPQLTPPAPRGAPGVVYHHPRRPPQCSQQRALLGAAQAPRLPLDPADVPATAGASLDPACATAGVRRSACATCRRAHIYGDAAARHRVERISAPPRQMLNMLEQRRSGPASWGSDHPVQGGDGGAAPLRHRDLAGMWRHMGIAVTPCLWPHRDLWPPAWGVASRQPKLAGGRMLTALSRLQRRAGGQPPHCRGGSGSPTPSAA